MKTSIKHLSILAVIIIAMTSCFNTSEEPTFVEADLLGLWLEKGTEDYVRFTNE